MGVDHTSLNLLKEIHTNLRSINDLLVNWINISRVSEDNSLADDGFPEIKRILENRDAVLRQISEMTRLNKTLDEKIRYLSDSDAPPELAEALQAEHNRREMLEKAAQEADEQLCARLTDELNQLKDKLAEVSRGRRVQNTYRCIQKEPQPRFLDQGR